MSGPWVRSVANDRLPGGIHLLPHNRIGGCPPGRCRVAILEDTGGKRYSIEWVGTAAPLEEGKRREIPFDLHKIGQMLKDTREEKGLTLDEVSTALFIKKRVIGAIESGDWDSLPYPVYVKGYINQYAALLHITDLLTAEMISPENQPSPEVQVVAEAPKHERTQEGRGPKNKVIAASAAGALLVGFLVFQNLPGKAYVAPPAQSVESTYQTPVRTSARTHSVEAGTTSQAAEESPVAAEESEKVIATSKKLAIVCQERTWVRIVVDGAERKEVMLNPKEVVMVSAEKSFDLLIGNAGGVKLFFNGRDTGFTGKSGEVRHIDLS